VCSSQANRLDHGLERVTAMLKDIHEWFVHNLKDTTLQTTQVVVTGTHDDQSTLFSGPKFEVYAESDQGLRLVCSHACLHRKWDGKHSRVIASSTPTLAPLFICRCSANQSHDARLAEYGRKLDFANLRSLKFTKLVISLPICSSDADSFGCS